MYCGYLTLCSILLPDGHLKFPHLWPPKFPQAGRLNYRSIGIAGSDFCLTVFLVLLINGCLASEARQAVGKMSRSCGQLSNRCVEPAVHRLVLWKGQLSTAGGCDAVFVLDRFGIDQTRHSQFRAMAVYSHGGRCDEASSSFLKPVTFALERQ